MNSDRLISAEKLVINLAKKNRFGRIEYDDIMAVIADAPTVDAVEVVHGRWKTIDFAGTVKCSVCGEETYCESKYCPNCGAKMDGGNEDETHL